MRPSMALSQAVLLAALVSGCVRGGGVEAPPAAPGGGEPPAPAPAPAKPRPELPLGGREIFPTYRLVGFCGTPNAPALGRLAGDLSAKAKVVHEYGEKYAYERKALPIFELIAVLVLGLPGADGKYRRRVDDAVVDAYLKAAREAKAVLLLNIQPGRSDFMTEVQHFEKYLREPDVGVALDPEWAMKKGQKPGEFYGQTTGPVINEVGAYLAGLVAQGDLPEKVLVYHQFNRAVLKDEELLEPHPGVVVIKSVDGWGPKRAKIDTYYSLVKSLPAGVHVGFKLFFDEDISVPGSKLMKPDEVMALSPQPEYIMYE
ncbi:MAG TPA: hypothetical protein VFS00_08080 [Polyangiaceae bacterium]|nr:hypothetical protein [Polyangiaceae bacterium]